MSMCAFLVKERCLPWLVSIFCWWPFFISRSKTMIISQHTYIWFKCEISLQDTYVQDCPSTQWNENPKRTILNACSSTNRGSNKCTTHLESSTRKLMGRIFPNSYQLLCPLHVLKKTRMTVENNSSESQLHSSFLFSPDSWFAQATGPSNVFARVWFTNCET